MGIITITSISQLNGILSEDKDKLSVKRSLIGDMTEIVLIAASLSGYRLPRYVVRQLLLIRLYPYRWHRETRCGPCDAIAPAYESLSNQYTSVNFLKCDVDAAFEVATVYSISAMCVAMHWSSIQFCLINYFTGPLLSFWKAVPK